jgi:hypothetical protein
MIAQSALVVKKKKKNLIFAFDVLYNYNIIKLAAFL